MVATHFHTSAGLAAVIICLAAALTPAAEPVDEIQGNWVGEWTLDGGSGGKQTAKIVGLGKGEYQAAFTAYDGSEQQNETFRFVISGTAGQNDKVDFSTSINLGEKLGTFEWTAEAQKGKLTGRYTNKKQYTGGFTLKRVELRPEAVGAKPLPGAIVLFDGKDLERWSSPDGSPSPWKVADGAVRVARRSVAGKEVAANLVCREPFKDAEIHLEYRVPYLPETRGIERGNSGVFLQGRYEIQIVDSFGQPREVNNFGQLADDDSAGAIFKEVAPRENATLPPGQWQALDITFEAAKLDADGKVKQPALMTVRHNGVLIHDREKVSRPTQGAPVRDLKTASGLVLEDGGQPVEFRNIWMVKLDAAQ
jgi:hypothetical protein